MNVCFNSDLFLIVFGFLNAVIVIGVFWVVWKALNVTSELMESD